MPRTPNRRSRGRRQEIAQQLADGMSSGVDERCDEQQVLVLMPTQSCTSNNSLASSELTECWRASSGAYETICNLFLTNDMLITCPIMQEPTCSALIEDLPGIWPLQNKNIANTVRLPCSHTFYVHALALHFLATDMRCPVCRTGSAVPMDILSVPLSIRHLYANKLSGLHQRTIENEVESIDPMHIVNVLENLEVEMRVFEGSEGNPMRTWSSHISTARTRVVFQQQHVEDIQRSILTVASSNSTDIDVSMTTNFTVHRSFQRLIRCIVGRRHMYNKQGVVRFALTHPLLPLSFRSNELSIADAWNDHFSAGATAAGCVPLFCGSIGGTEPVAYLRSVYCSESNTTSITVDVNMHIIINISSYVSDVLDSIRESVRQHTSLDYPSIATLDAHTNLETANVNTLDAESFPTLAHALAQPPVA